MGLSQSELTRYGLLEVCDSRAPTRAADTNASVVKPRNDGGDELGLSMRRIAYLQKIKQPVTCLDAGLHFVRISVPIV